MSDVSDPWDRFWSKVDVRGPDECWRWTGAHIPGGYGYFWSGSERMSAHTWHYEQTYGPAPDGDRRRHPVDHVKDRGCQWRDCVNLAHLERVTRQANILRGEGPTALNSRTTHCPQGHPYDEANTYVDPTGRRHCRACSYERTRQWASTDRGKAVAADPARERVSSGRAAEATRRYRARKAAEKAR